MIMRWGWIGLPFLAAILMMLSAGGAHAEQITLSLGEAQQVLSGLALLSKGQEVVIGEGAAAKVVVQPYKGWSMATSLALAKNITALKPAVLDFETARDLRRMALQDPNCRPSPAETCLTVANQRALLEEGEKLKAQQMPFDLAKIKPADLKLTDNAIAPTTLSALAPVLDVP